MTAQDAKLQTVKTITEKLTQILSPFNILCYWVDNPNSNSSGYTIHFSYLSNPPKKWEITSQDIFMAGLDVEHLREIVESVACSYLGLFVADSINRCNWS